MGAKDSSLSEKRCGNRGEVATISQSQSCSETTVGAFPWKAQRSGRETSAVQGTQALTLRQTTTEVAIHRAFGLEVPSTQLWRDSCSTYEAKPRGLQQ